MKSRLILSRAGMQKFAAGAAKEIAAQKTGQHATVIALVGELGAGKTTFAQGFLKQLGVKSHVSSPTFLIIKPHTLRKLPYTRAFHIDCYRLNKPQELIALGLKDILKNPAHIVLIEWPKLIKKYLPKNTRWITISHSKLKETRGRRISSAFADLVGR